MRGPHNDDIVACFAHAKSVIELNHAAIDSMLGSLETDAMAETERRKLAFAAADLERVTEGLIRTGKLIERLTGSDEPTSPLEWELDRMLVNSYAGCRGISIKSRNGIGAGTIFRIDDFWRENDVFIGVVWKTSKPRFDWLTPLELRTWTRPLPPIGDPAAEAHVSAP